MAEKTATDAPVWYNSDEASAWANGHNSAIEQMMATIASLRSEVASLKVELARAKVSANEPITGEMFDVLMGAGHGK
jgi:hypothetical protein